MTTATALQYEDLLGAPGYADGNGCFKLALELYRRFGHDLPDTGSAFMARFEEIQRKPADLEPGELMVIWFSPEGRAIGERWAGKAVDGHAATCVRPGFLLHAQARVGVVCMPAVKLVAQVEEKGLGRVAFYRLRELAGTEGREITLGLLDPGAWPPPGYFGE